MKLDVIITSCGRFDLLQDTLDALLKYYKDDINNVFVYDDYGSMDKDMTKDFWSLAHLYDGTPNVKITKGARNIGQVAAIDFLMKHVTTEFYFHGEEDFTPIASGGFEEAVRILREGNPVVGSVSLRGGNSRAHNFQPIIKGILQPYMGWSGWQYAPSVRRLRDYELYSELTGWNAKKPWLSEQTIGNYYMRNKKQIFATTETAYFEHRGGGRSTYGHEDTC